jgi:hydroxymethylpyrimidine pyrophosphatase-like HAD family hydrolase
VKLSVVALDYDGTIAENGVVHDEIHAVIGELRHRGIIVVIVTGRRLSDLRAAAGDLRCVDAVIAENGAVFAIPGSGHATAFGLPPSSRFIETLQQRGIPFAQGECIVDADAQFAGSLLQTIRDLELPLVLAFNRGRVMVLPQGISKATGLRDGLAMLRLSLHNTLGIGDAENDHELLRACEVGAAVNWGSACLKATADEIVEGSGPEAVAQYLRRVFAEPAMSRPGRGRHQVVLGHDVADNVVSLAIRGRNLLVTGEPKSGKSWAAGLVAEQLILQRYSVCVIDPEGDYGSLEALPGVTTFGGDDPAPKPRAILRAFRHPDASGVIDLSQMPHPDKVECVRTLLPTLARLRNLTGLPHRIVLDEAHYFLQDPDFIRELDLAVGGYTFVTYRVSGLHPNVLSATEALVVTRQTDPRERQWLQAAVAPASLPDDVGRLPAGQGVLFSEVSDPGVVARPFRLATRLTPHVRHRSKYVDVPVPASRAFVFTENGASAGANAETLTGLISGLAGADRETIDGHLRRHDFSRWLTDVFGDHVLAAEIRRLENRSRLESIVDIRESIIKAIGVRYHTIDPGAFPEQPAF